MSRSPMVIAAELLAALDAAEGSADPCPNAAMRLASELEAPDRDARLVAHYRALARKVLAKADE